MATLTYDPTEADAPEFSAEEQDSLQVGEELAQQQEALLAGKFRDAEELEQAYVELQRKLGSRNSDNEPEAETEVEAEEAEESPDEEEEAPSDFLETLWEEAHQEFSAETLDKLKDLRAVDVAQMYLQYRQQAESQGPKFEVATEEQVNSIQQSVGGPQEYSNMLQWASNNLSEQEITMFDTVMDRGDPLAMYFAAQALNMRYRDNTGYEGKLVTGKAPKQAVDAFRSQAELVRAMSDPRYDSDPAYRADVAAKLENSDLNF